MNNQTIPVLAVIGGGASGVTAAIFAARESAAIGKEVRIRIYESSDRILKKILVTGNGRCNLSNTDVSSARYFGAVELFNCVYRQFDRAAVISFFESIGLHTVSDSAGRIYPRSMKAASVADMLLYAAEKENIEIILNTKITSLQRCRNGYLLNGAIPADAVIVSTGGMIDASGKRSDSFYGTLREDGINITPLYPALTAFTVRDFTKSLKGIRAQGTLTLFADEKKIANTTGEIQYTEYGISGIPALQLSSYAARVKPDSKMYISVDSLPEINDENFSACFMNMQQTSSELPVLLFLTGFLPKALSIYLMKEAGVKQDLRMYEAGKQDIRRLLDCCKRMRYPVKGLRGFENAQVTSGGIAQHEINSNLMLKKMPGVYVCGEIVDINGDCGGYNLQWAWSSGALAGKNSILEMQ